ncbi:MAG: type II secretion system F family protein, partial [Thermoguttaceae bacterium]
MLDEMMGNGTMIAFFVTASSCVGLLYLLLGMRKDPTEQRLEDLSLGRDLNGKQQDFYDNQKPQSSSALTLVDNPVNQWTNRRIQKQEKQNDFKRRMIHAGLYSSSAANLFFLLRIIFLLGPAALGFMASQTGYLSLSKGLFLGILVGIAGTLAPSFWLDRVKKSRQTKIRRALPDALDVIVVCLEGGLSLTGALSRVAHELAVPYPLLAVELKIVERQMQLGQSTGLAMREFANRFDLEELRSMASVILQAERIGSSVVGALRVFADTMRQKRQLSAEETA